MHELGLAAEIVDHARAAQAVAEIQLDQLLRRDAHQPDRPAQAVERARLLQRQRDPGHGRALRVVAAGMGAAVHRLHMVRRAQRIQLRHDEQLRAGPSGLDIRVEAGDIPRLDERIAHLFKHVLHIRSRLPLAEARLRVPPDIVLRREDLLAVLVNECLIELGLHGVASS